MDGYLGGEIKSDSTGTAAVAWDMGPRQTSWVQHSGPPNSLVVRVVLQRQPFDTFSPSTGRSTSPRPSAVDLSNVRRREDPSGWGNSVMSLLLDTGQGRSTRRVVATDKAPALA
ncbi:hypothetical protein E4U43_004522 [Claviceps pusilla]|uniref:Uncharacterized protein n=1 Tax=Claviceps pusilla TaxID=123648 RepID=A0A9P7N3A1_9HYPO|nr:hypothetical protein E4U43_004522 [Claviceps pusilla]